jgi:glycosyltransferase involved in cell wall biosynthesis
VYLSRSAPAPSGRRGRLARADQPAGASGWTLAHEFFYEYGGAERVAERLAEAMPGSPVLYLGGSDEVLRQVGIEERATPALPRWLVRRGSYHPLTPAYPRLLRRAPLVEGNLFVSGYAFAPGLKATGRKVVYCHSPLRQIWSGYEDYLKRLPRLQATVLRRSVEALRRHDRAAYQDVDQILVPSSSVAERVRRVYGRESKVVPPPYDDTVFTLGTEERDPHQFVTTARLVDASKNLTFLLRVFALLPELRLTVIGSGRDAKRLERLAPANVTFLGLQPPERVAAELRRSAGYVQANVEDYGIATVESLACGTPVYAFARGGVLDLVQDGANGRFFDQLDESAVAALLRAGLQETWRPELVAGSVSHLTPAAFARQIQRVLTDVGQAAAPTRPSASLVS